MFNCFIPDFMFDTFDAITPAFLKEQGIRFLLIDIDNTLAPYEEPLPREHTKAWFDALAENGIRAILVSNNHADRVELFNSQLGLPAFADCHKPSPKRLRSLLAQFEADVNETAALGDQIFTDTLGANGAGVTSILVKAIDNHNFWLKARHVLEKPFIFAARKRRIS